MGKYTTEIIILVVLLLILGAAIFYFVVQYRNFTDCNTSESNICPSYSCGRSKETTHEVCYGDSYNTAFMPYRYTDNGVECMDPKLAPVIYRKPSATLFGSSF